MKIITKKRNMIWIFIAICLISTGALATFKAGNTTAVHAYAMAGEKLI